MTEDEHETPRSTSSLWQDAKTSRGDCSPEERVFFDKLDIYLAGRDHHVRDSALIDKLVGELREEWEKRDGPTTPTSRTPSLRRRALFVGSALAIAAGLLLILKVRRPTDDAESPRTHAQTTPEVNNLVLASGGIRSGESTATTGRSVPRGLWFEATASDTCLAMASGAKLCLSQGSRARTGTHHHLELDDGHLHASLSLAESVVIVARETSVTAQDASFTIDAEGPLDMVIVTVITGTVEVQPHGGTSRRIAAGESLRVGDLPREGAPGIEQDVRIASVHRAASRVQTPSASDLLESARRIRATGNIERTAEIYRRLLRAHPNGVESRVALVLLGQIELEELGRPHVALRQFDRYLAGGPGDLREEASHGRIRALRELGRENDERDAIEAFLSDHPQSVHASRFRERLRELVP